MDSPSESLKECVVNVRDFELSSSNLEKGGMRQMTECRTTRFLFEFTSFFQREMFRNNIHTRTGESIFMLLETFFRLSCLHWVSGVVLGCPCEFLFC